jgi:formylglycine-generating enzyme required for sulfatase activity
VPVYTIAESTNPADWGTVQGATWDAAICNWNANGYRLLTEAEWEYAARGATNTPDYVNSGSNDIATVAWYSGNSENSTWPVGSKNPNGIGIHDMSGNVWEWCWNWYGTYSDSPQDNPTGPENGTHRVRRGGSWQNGTFDCRVPVRHAYHQSYAFNNGGFRVCRTAN